MNVIPKEAEVMVKSGERVLSLLLVACALLAGCQTVVGAHGADRYNRSPLSVTIPAGLTSDAVQQTMVQVLESRMWEVVQQSPQEVVGTLDHGSFRAKAILRVDGDRIKILSDSLYVSPDTGETTPGVPKGWLENIQKDLEVRLIKKAGRAKGAPGIPE